MHSRLFSTVGFIAFIGMYEKCYRNEQPVLLFVLFTAYTQYNNRIVYELDTCTDQQRMKQLCLLCLFEAIFLEKLEIFSITLV